VSGLDQMEPGIRCSVLVLNFELRDVLLDCLASLQRAAGPNDEIILVDNASTDDSVAAVRAAFPDVRVVENASNRYIFGLNDGLAVARGRYVAFCNNDMTVEDDFIEAMVACFDADDVFAACARIVQPDGRDQGSRTAGIWKHGLLFYEPLAHADTMTSCFFAVGGQSLFRRDLLVGLGSIDELLWPMYHEDIELSYRAWKAGLRILYAPDAVCHHLGSQTSARVFTRIELRSFVRQNELLTVWKNVDDPVMLLQHVAWLGPRLALALLRRDRATLAGFGSALRRLPRAVGARSGARRTARRSDRDVLALVGPTAVEASARVAP
jgi:GT2 family glycosyltransferase